MKTSAHYENALGILAVAVGRNAGVRVIFDAKIKTACTSGEFIFLQPVEITNQQNWEMVEGFLYHEAAHVRFTDFQFYRDNQTNPSLKTILNILEDARIETALEREYKGLISLFRILREKLDDNLTFNREIGLENSIYNFLLSYLGICRNHIHELSYYGEIKSFLMTNLGNEFVTKIEKISSCVFKCVSTQEVLALAKEIYDLIVTEAQTQNIQENPIQEQNGDRKGASDASGASSQSQNGAQSGNQGGNGASEANNAAWASSQSQNGAQNGNQGDNGASKTSDASGDSSQNQTGTQDGNQGGNNASEANNAAWASSQSQNGAQNGNQGDNGASKTSDASGYSSQSQTGTQDGNRGENAFSKSRLDLDKMNEAAKAIKGLGETLQEQIAAMRVSNSGISQLPCIVREGHHGYPVADIQHVAGNLVSLRQAVLTDVYKRSAPGYSGNRLNVRKLAGLAAGVDMKGFLSRYPQKELDTYIHLLVDCSSSMSTYSNKDGISFMDSVNMSFLGLLEALYEVPKIRLEVSGFKTQGGKPVIIPHSKNRFDGFLGSGRTPLTEALQYTFYQTIIQNERRKIVIVLTDGEPDDAPSARTALAHFKSVGIQVIGVLIGDQKSLFDLSVRIQNADELASALNAIWLDLLYPDR
jgi:hypothetical protein